MDTDADADGDLNDDEDDYEEEQQPEPNDPVAATERLLNAIQGEYHFSASDDA